MVYYYSKGEFVVSMEDTYFDIDLLNPRKCKFNLEIGKHYEIFEADINSNIIGVINEVGLRDYFFKDRFKPISEHRSEIIDYILL